GLPRPRCFPGRRLESFPAPPTAPPAPGPPRPPPAISRRRRVTRMTPRPCPDEPAMGEAIQLGADEVVADRPFTALEHTAGDLAAIRAMAAGLRESPEGPLPRGSRPPALTLPATA